MVSLGSGDVESLTGWTGSGSTEPSGTLGASDGKKSHD